MDAIIPAYSRRLQVWHYEGGRNEVPDSTGIASPPLRRVPHFDSIQTYQAVLAADRKGDLMKLRIKGDSLRLRISPSEVSRLLLAGRIEETIHFGPDDEAKLTYSVMTSSGQGSVITVRHVAQDIAVVIPLGQVRAWADSEQVGIYGSISTGAGQLELALEKDFACLDQSNEENRDTYPHPGKGLVC
jgi:uncharacterized protein DUF7009